MKVNSFPAVCSAELPSYSPSTPDLPGLVPDFLEERIVLDDDGVLDVRSLGCGGSIAVRVTSCGHSTLKQKIR